MIIFDLDNTLRHTKDDYPHTPFAKGKCPEQQCNWVQWQHFANDTGQPIQHMVKFYEMMRKLELETITIVTSSQFGTKEWMLAKGLTMPDSIIERQPNDNLSGVDYKKQYIKLWKDKITLWVDDHIETCDYVESLNIPVVRVKHG